MFVAVAQAVTDLVGNSFSINTKTCPSHILLLDEGCVVVWLPLRIISEEIVHTALVLGVVPTYDVIKLKPCNDF